MSFLLPLGLLLALTAIFPILAHALRKGQEQTIDFPAARLVPEHKSSAQKKHRLQDHLLLALRVLMLLCLALLAASPFVRCSRLSLSRTDGASVAAALVIDDSASMRARTEGDRTRLDAALSGAQQLLDTARPGDTFSLVLAGYPARVLTPPTTELASVRDALSEISASDRRTDLKSALDLARSLQKDVPQSDRPIVLLSDLSTTESLDLSGTIIPEAGLRERLENCALLSALRVSEAVTIEVACTSAEALKGRTVRLVDGNNQGLTKGEEARDGVVRLSLPRKLPPSTQLFAELSTPRDTSLDQIESDNRVLVLESAAALSVALRADQGKAGHKTGSTTVIQAALESLERGLRVQTISLLPDSAKDLDPFGALFIDDPSGLTPETSDAIAKWTRRGGVAMVFLGPSVTSTPLGSTFAPFLPSAVTWQDNPSKGANAKSPGALGPLTTTWNDLGAKKRASFTVDEDALTKASWDDGAPLVTERALGRGLLLSVSLPASVDRSDLALRPAFLELLDYAVHQSAVRRGAQATPVGQHWPVDDHAVVEAPDGTALTHHLDSGRAAGGYVEPHLAGRYTIRTPGEAPEESSSTRVAMLERTEQISQPNLQLQAGAQKGQKATLTKVGISREVALAALVLGLLELAFRIVKRGRRTRNLAPAS